MNFGSAVAKIKEGHRVARSGWNGKHMFVYLTPGSAPRSTQVQPVTDDFSLISGIDASLFEDADEGSIVRLPALTLRTAGGETLVGWLASQTDILAEDWTVVA